VENNFTRDSCAKLALRQDSLGRVQADLITVTKGPLNSFSRLHAGVHPSRRTLAHGISALLVRRQCYSVCVRVCVWDGIVTRFVQRRLPCELLADWSC
jgi:hypothetical protein